MEQEKTTSNTVAVTVSETEPALIVPLDEAQAEYNVLNSLSLTFDQDKQLLRALAVALNPMPKPPLGRMPDGRTRAEHTIEKWRAAEKGKNG